MKYTQIFKTRVAESDPEVFGWSRSQVPKNTRNRSWIFYPTPTPEVELNYFFTIKSENVRQ